MTFIEYTLVCLLRKPRTFFCSPLISVSYLWNFYWVQRKFCLVMKIPVSLRLRWLYHFKCCNNTISSSFLLSVSHCQCFWLMLSSIANRPTTETDLPKGNPTAIYRTKLDCFDVQSIPVTVQVFFLFKLPKGFSYCVLFIWIDFLNDMDKYASYFMSHYNINVMSQQCHFIWCPHWIING